MSATPGIISADPIEGSPGVPRALVVGWLAAFAGFLWLQGKSNGFTDFAALPNSVTVVELIEVFVLTRLFAAGDTQVRLTAVEAGSTLAGAAAVLLLGARTAPLNAWIAGASLIALYVLVRFWRVPAQRAFAVALCVFVAQYLQGFGPFIWLHGLCGKIDAAVLRGLLGALGYDVAGTGTLIVRQSSGFVVDIYYGCASTFALGLVLPAFLIVVLGLRGSWRAGEGIYLAALTAITVGVNLLRLMPTVLSKQGHAFWHDGTGAALVSAFYAILILAAAYAATRQQPSDAAA